MKNSGLLFKQTPTSPNLAAYYSRERKGVGDFVTTLIQFSSNVDESRAMSQLSALETERINLVYKLLIQYSFAINSGLDESGSALSRELQAYAAIA
jgi:hypothetical protein